MVFNSVDFLIFFPIVILLYFLVPKKVRYIWLLGASLYFYMCCNVKYMILLLVSIFTTWLAGILVQKLENTLARKWTVAMCLFVNIGILFFFKYFDFVIASCNKVLSRVGIQALENSFNVLLPVGISFYTFQALGYIIDVYRGKIEAEVNPLRYALFVSFFPQLVAGPIERSENLLNQVRNVDKMKIWNYENVTSGLTLMVWGLFVKMVIADRVAILVNTVFDGVYFYGSVALIAGAVGFALQIYCDFMGYSTIAVGAARVMGFTLMENFDTPYLATSVSEFWRRWHISLSTWFRDYVYIPLGGNRCSRIRKYFNLMVTFGISGLWHGANWTYVFWGLLHGMYQVVGDITKSFRTKLFAKCQAKTESFSFKLAQMAGTFILVDIAWIFFKADSLRIALDYCKRLFTKWDPWSLFNGEIYNLGLDRSEFNILIVASVALLLVDLLRYCKKQMITDFLKEQCIWFRWGVIFALIFAVIIYGMYGVQFESSQFIYFQF
ncbi:MAG: MBOAT family protein [Lachnospiraceae bacterium]|nr:MBOAT family protein [Lachnospiraceae bacterium]